MSDEAQEQVPAAAPAEAAPEPEAASEPAPAEEPKKSVSFQKNDELTFDEAQAEIDAIKARAGQARESLKTSSPSTTSYGASYSSSSKSFGSFDDDSSKSKNMLSHLNSHSAMLNYKVQAARSLVRKQEDLLRNLARMRENMERSETELFSASDYYSSARHRPYGYFERRAESAPFISRRPAVREVSPVCQSSLEFTEQLSSMDKGASPALPSIASHVSNPIASTNDYQPDEEFEKEMAAIRKRVSDLSKKANEIPAPRYRSYEYESVLGTPGYAGGCGDLYGGVPESKFEVKTTNHIPTKRYGYVPRTTNNHSSVYSRHVPAVITTVSEPAAYPCSSFTQYVMDSLNEVDYPYACGGAASATSYGDLYDPLMSADIPLAY